MGMMICRHYRQTDEESNITTMADVTPKTGENAVSTHDSDKVEETYTETEQPVKRRGRPPRK